MAPAKASKLTAFRVIPYTDGYAASGEEEPDTQAKVLALIARIEAT